MTALDSIKQFTIIVADTGDFGSIQKFQPQDATTNPSLLYSASKVDKYAHLIDEGIEYAKSKGDTLDKKVELAVEKIAVNFGVEILKIIPGRVSTEIDARLSFDTQKTVAKAREIIALYKDAGIGTDRVLIKIASTWEGLQAATILENEGIHVNMTLMFSLCQAMAAAEANVTLISPFVGRITDYHKQKQGVNGFPAAEDPGVLSVQSIYNYLKTHGYKTLVMGASFRNKEQVIELAGCDLLTVSPSLLQELMNLNQSVERKLSPENVSDVPKTVLTEPEFRWRLNQDDCANFKLAEGITKFAEDLVKLENEIRARLQ